MLHLGRELGRDAIGANGVYGDDAPYLTSQRRDTTLTAYPTGRIRGVVSSPRIRPVRTAMTSAHRVSDSSDPRCRQLTAYPTDQVRGDVSSPRIRMVS